MALPISRDDDWKVSTARCEKERANQAKRAEEAAAAKEEAAAASNAARPEGPPMDSRGRLECRQTRPNARARGLAALLSPDVEWTGKGGWQGKGQWHKEWQVYVDEAATHDLAVDPESWAMARDHESTHDSWFWPVASAKSVEDVDVEWSEWQDYDYEEEGSKLPTTITPTTPPPSTPAPSHQPVTNDAPPPRPAPTTHPHDSTTNKDVMNEMTRRIDRLEILHIEKARVMEGKIDGLEGKIDETLHILKAEDQEDPRNMPPEEAMALYGNLKHEYPDVDSGSAAVAAAS